MELVEIMKEVVRNIGEDFVVNGSSVEWKLEYWSEEEIKHNINRIYNEMLMRIGIVEYEEIEFDDDNLEVLVNLSNKNKINKVVWSGREEQIYTYGEMYRLQGANWKNKVGKQLEKVYSNGVHEGVDISLKLYSYPKPDAESTFTAVVEYIPRRMLIAESDEAYLFNRSTEGIVYGAIALSLKKIANMAQVDIAKIQAYEELYQQEIAKQSDINFMGTKLAQREV